MRKLLFCVVAAAALAACNNGSSHHRNNGSDSALNNAFSSYEQRFIEALWQQNPDWATNVGYHKYDSVLIVPDSAAAQAQLAFSKQQLDSLKSFDLATLNDANKIDYQLIQDYLQSVQWAMYEFKSKEWYPSSFNVSNTFAFILNENYAPLESRLRSFAGRLQNIPAWYEAAAKQRQVSDRSED